MWSLPWSPWVSWSSQDKEPEEVKKQTKAGEGQRSQRGVKYYQRNRSEETSADIDERAGMYKGKVKPPGGAKRASGDQQQGDGAELDDDWQVVPEEELQALANVKARGGSKALTPEGREMVHLGSELMAGSGPASTLSTDSGAYNTPLSSLSEQDRGVHQGLVQLGSSDSDVILHEESIAKDTTIRQLKHEVNQLQRRLKYAEQLEEQNIRLVTEESKHEQEKQLMKAEIQQLQRKASVSRPYTRGYAHEQKLQETVKHYEREYNEQLEENSKLQEKISQIEKGMCEDNVVTHIDDMGDSDLKVELKKKEQHIKTLQTQVESLQQHSKGQSRQVLQLKQELEALKATGEEVDKSWRDMVDQLEEENRKLSLDVVSLHRDMHFMEKSVEALKNEKQKVEKQRDCFQLEVEQLRADLAVTDNEGAKEEKKRKSMTDNSFEQEVQRLQKELEEAKSFQKDAVLHHSQTVKLTTKLSEMEEESRRVHTEKRHLEGSYKTLESEINSLRAQLHTKEAQVGQLMSDRPVQRAGTAESAEEVSQLRRQLGLKEREISKLKSQLSEKHSQVVKLTTKLSEMEEESRRVRADYRQLEGSYKVLYNDVAKFQQLLQEKNAMIECKSQQLQTYEKTVADLMKIVECTNRQSHIVKDFKQQLAKTEKSCTGNETALVATRHENDHLRKEIEQLSEKNAQLDFQLRQLQELAQSRRNVTQLTTVVEQLHKEKANLMEEVEAHEFTIETFAKETEEWRSACNAERSRREALERRIAELEYEFWNIPRSEVYLNMQKFLGSGAWGFVVEGTFRGQQVAVKCLHDMIRAPKFVEVMRKEITIMAQVQHPNLVLLIAAVVDAENDPLIVTELLDISLRKAYEKKRLQGSSKLSIFRDIAAALNYLHLRHCGEIIHRDVSSSNVLLEAKPNNQWKAKLSDFGSAKLAMEAKTTAPGAFVYAAPEVRKEMGIRQTTKLDVYSYGILLCEVIVEQFPDEESFPSMMKEVRGKWAFMHRLITSCVQDDRDERPTMSYILSEFSEL